MKYTFNKEIVPRKFVQGQGWLSNLKTYKLFEADKLIGTFDYHDTLHIISFLDREFIIEVKEPFFRRSSYNLFDKSTNELIGDFKLSLFAAQSLRVDKLRIGKKDLFIFEEVRSDIPFSVFKKSSWGHCKFQFSNGTEAAVYSLKVDRPLICSSLEYRPLAGEVELWGDSILLIFAGFYLIERRFRTVDN